MIKKKIIITTGGTGGHLFPAQKLAKQLLNNNYEILFVGGELSSSLYFDQQAYDYNEISCATVFTKKPLSFLRGVFLIFKGFFQSIKIINKFKPDYVIGFGGFHSFPALLAALVTRKTILLHEQNVILGKVNKIFSYFAKICFISFPKTEKFLKTESVLVKFPCKHEKQQTACFKESSYEYFNISKEHYPIILIFGGSQGSHKINILLVNSIKEIKNIYPNCFLIHLIGSYSNQEYIEDVYKKENVNFCLKSFEHNMQKAFSVADLAITRGGASTIWELIEWKIPAVVIPLKNSANNHQLHNANYLSEIGVSITLEEDDIDHKTFHILIKRLLENKTQRYFDEQQIEFKDIVTVIDCLES